jgi:hypothetical protein
VGGLRQRGGTIDLATVLGVAPHEQGLCA